MPPTLVADNNGGFGGVLINQKYSPLVFGDEYPAAADKDSFSKIYNTRIKTLSDVDVFPKKISLFTRAWPAVAAGTPPMVVISSNRAEWMQELFETAKTKNELDEFTGYLDVTTFQNGPVPWYSPLRSLRPVFIVVHQTEYGYYQRLLGGFANVYVVGWRIINAKGKFGLAPVGFGASRFAALELVKKLGYTYAWSVDDNVVNINGFPNRLTTIEANMSENIAAIGFKATTKNVTGVAQGDGTVKFSTAVFDFGAQVPGLLQQVVLWNLALLRKNDLSVSPYFVSSNEDVSLSNYLQVSKIAEKIISPLSIVKMQPENDKENTGATLLADMRAQLLYRLFQKEKETLIQMGVAAAVEIAAFVANTVLPNSQSPKNDLFVTQSMAIEQALALGVSKKWAPTEIFKPFTGFNGTRVELLPKPAA